MTLSTSRFPADVTAVPSQSGSPSLLTNRRCLATSSGRGIQTSVTTLALMRKAGCLIMRTTYPQSRKTIDK